MKVDIVVDVGNSRIKWGNCGADRVLDWAPLPSDEPEAWVQQLKEWGVASQALVWAVSGVQPARLSKFKDWLADRRDRIVDIASYRQLPLQVEVPFPERVGIDRLLNAVAAIDRVKRFAPLIVIDAGSAVTVDFIDEAKRFQGGAIFPGMRLMAQALHDYTALLPIVEVRDRNPELPAKHTPHAMEAGIYWAVAGGIKALVRQLLAKVPEPGKRQIFLTGGDASLLASALGLDYVVWPEMTLEGLRLTAEALPEAGLPG